MKSKIYRATSLLIAVMLMFLLPVATSAEQKKIYSVTLKNDQVFLNGKQITKSASKKSKPIISPDNKKIMYVCTYKDFSVQLGVFDTSTKTEKIIKIDQGYTQIMDIEWLSTQKIGMIVHINPSLESYQIYDVIMGKNIESYFGYGFIFNQSKTAILYIQSPPHFSAQQGEYNVMLNNSVLYKTDKKTFLDNVLYPSYTFKKVAFYELNIEDENKSNIVILTIENNKVKSKKKIAWNKEICQLKWEKENVLYIGDLAKYDFLKSKLITKEVKTLKAFGVENVVKVGDLFKVILKGNPSTGYSWYYTIDNDEMLESRAVNETPDKENVPGSGSTFTWNFKALKTGQVKLVYKYYRSFEGEATATKENTIEYLVKVQN